MDLLGLMTLAAAGGLLAYTAADGLRRRREGLDSWRLVAARRGGRVRGSTTDAGIEVRAGLVVVEVAALELTDFGDGGRRTRARAAAIIRPGPRWIAGPRPRRRRDVVDVSLDGGRWHLAVHADERADAEAMWRGAEGLLAALPPARLVHHGIHVTCEVDGVVFDPVALDAMIDVVATLASWDAGVAAALAALPGAERAVEDDLDLALAVRLAVGPPVLVGVAVDTRGSRLVARLEAPPRVEPLSLRLEPGVPAPLPAAAQAALAGVRGRLRVTDDGAELIWDAVERDASHIRAGVEGLRALADGFALGPYRT